MVGALGCFDQHIIALIVLHAALGEGAAVAMGDGLRADPSQTIIAIERFTLIEIGLLDHPASDIIFPGEGCAQSIDLQGFMTKLIVFELGFDITMVE